MSDSPTMKNVTVLVDQGAVQATTLTFVNHAMAHSTQSEIVLTLFQIAPPPISEKEFEALTSVRANCVGRLVMTWPSAVAILDILAKTIQEHRTLLEKQSKAAESRKVD
jgi:hypothetical protein